MTYFNIPKDQVARAVLKALAENPNGLDWRQLEQITGYDYSRIRRGITRAKEIVTSTYPGEPIYFDYRSGLYFLGGDLTTFLSSVRSTIKGLRKMMDHLQVGTIDPGMSKYAQHLHRGIIRDFKRHVEDLQELEAELADLLQP